MEVSSMTPNTKQTVLEPCPFCGCASAYFERIGTPFQSCVVECGDCGARLETGEEGQDCGCAWNHRAAPAPVIRNPRTTETPGIVADEHC
ncbi:Lar family restriction alleviation protein [Bordetella avium]|uniref:Lar family restriction alleviation protein n=4 Tax=Bordetella avium TaxID=521 RepID=UPI000E0B5B44|nr:restriction alleviation protein, Lar family [Bordetella avium]RIQ37167.1 restriction alleviation protein, Lar family [Bordetella avium]RIQ40383.1 restriction alleviation protein, Lar family [Bordetella avium]RIQ41969.1 restriction alleviation protein, Lar family [Bordetella avium]RIQ47961.1 restriction alleviation protein, Lar family [Bordetella avium]